MISLAFLFTTFIYDVSVRTFLEIKNAKIIRIVCVTVTKIGGITCAKTERLEEFERH